MRGLLVALAATVAALGAAPAGADPATAVHPYRMTNADQVVVVSTEAWGDTTGTLTTYSWNGTEWTPVLGPVLAFLGGNGLTDDPHESDDFTPTGQYAFTFAFGAEPNPGTAMPYVQVTDDDHWVDDPASDLYNTYQQGDGDGRWDSAETLSNYPYALAFDFNQDPVVPGGNSAIFLHEGEDATLGCIAIDSDSFQSVLQWLSPDARPEIVIGVQVGPPDHPVTASASRPATAHAAPGRDVTLRSPAVWPVVALLGLLALFAFSPRRRR
jgi:L,D-peptidoglycan transpeptidase YkuD (ErfK/YbiS/YcfS/YnhG family)